MRKMSQYLNSEKVQFFKSLGELSAKIKTADLVYAGYVLDEIDPELVEVYLESLWIKVKNQGFLVLVEYGNPFGARIIHEARKWILKKANASISAPCPHHMRCPLARSS
jgi:ribosomal protein RSM22 (predicted rRNA methylase)